MTGWPGSVRATVGRGPLAALRPALRLRLRFLTEVGTLGFEREGIVLAEVG